MKSSKLKTKAAAVIKIEFWVKRGQSYGAKHEICKLNRFLVAYFQLVLTCIHTILRNELAYLFMILINLLNLIKFSVLILNYLISLQTKGGQQRRSLVSQAHGVARSDRISADRPAAGASGQRRTHPGSVWQRSGAGVHRGLRARLLEAGLRKVDTLEEHARQRGEMVRSLIPKEL